MEPSTLPTVAGDHCLSPGQVLALGKAVDTLDAFMVQSVEEKHQNLWDHPGTKELVDFRVRGLVVCGTMETFQ